MPCRSPLKAYYKAGGGITFDRRESYGPAWAYQLHCGVCRDCRVRRARDWAIRCVHEASLHTHNSFLTLTYEHDPISINRHDPQRAIKLLRHQGRKFSYFGCGEYGSKLSRPHYHLCLFGEDFTSDRYPWKREKGNLLYRSPSLEKAWEHGHALIGDLTRESAQYTAGYVQKKINGDMAEFHYRRENTGVDIPVLPEFSMASTKPAIGKRWIEKHWRDVYPCDFVVHKGREYPVPAYYDKWLAIYQPEIWEEVRKKRQAYAIAQEPERGLRMAQAAQARDARYDAKRRSYENQT